MRFTFLGTGTSAGVPLIACSCAVCTSSDERDKRLRTGACVQFVDSTGQERTILIDTTPDLREQALRAGLTRCDAVIYTHNHVDHTFGLDEVRRFNAAQKSPIDVYAEAHTLDHLRRVYQHIFEAAHNVNQSFVATLIAHEIGPETPIDLFGVRFTPIRLLHGRLPGWGPIERQTRTQGVRTSGLRNLSLPPLPTTDVRRFRRSRGGCCGGEHAGADAWPRITRRTSRSIVANVERVGVPHVLHPHVARSGARETNAVPEGVRLAPDGLTWGSGAVRGCP